MLTRASVLCQGVPSCARGDGGGGGGGDGDDDGDDDDGGGGDGCGDADRDGVEEFPNSIYTTPDHPPHGGFTGSSSSSSK